MIGEKALVFDLLGEIAHFRAYYTNASSISYGFPPRTALEGFIGAILGFERDSYYDDLSPEKCKFSVSIKNPIRKSIYSINYVRTKPDEDNFNSFENAVNSYLKRNINTYPISIEIVLPIEDILRYRVYFYSTDKDLFKNLKEKLENSKTHYSVYLGITEFLADIDFVGEFEIKNPDKSRGVVSVLSEKFFDNIEFKEDISIILEKMPIHFTVHNGFRKILGVKKYIYEKNCKGIPVKDYRGVYSINGENIVWME